MTEPFEVNASKIFESYEDLFPDTGGEKLLALSAVSIAISLKRIADAIVADIEQHNSDVPGPLTRIADEVCGVPYDRTPGADNSRHALGLVDGIMHAIEQGLLAASQRG